MNLKTTFLFTFAVLPVAAVAAEGRYFGFRLGHDAPQQIIKTLKQSASAFEANYGYRGYAHELPVIKITRDPKFGRFTGFRKAWLEFGPGRHPLYRIEAIWKGNDRSKTFTLLRDGLSAKYKSSGRCTAFGFDTVCRWQDQKGKVAITLRLNTFGINTTTTLSYEWKPLKAAVEKARRQVDADIRRRNALKAGDDL